MKPPILYIIIFSVTLVAAVLVVYLGFVFKPELFGAGAGAGEAQPPAVATEADPVVPPDSAFALSSVEPDTSIATQRAVLAALEDSLKKLSVALALEKEKQQPSLLVKAMPTENKDTISTSAVKGMAKMLEAMKPDQAVRIMSNLNDTEVREIIKNLNKRQASKILAALDPSRAAKLIR